MAEILVYLRSLLIRAGLEKVEADLYLYIVQHPACTIAEACRNLKWSKSNIYRAFEHLKKSELLYSTSKTWKNSLQATSLKVLIRKLENEQLQKKRLALALKMVNFRSDLQPNSHIQNLETLNEEETFQRYLDLSEMSWGSMLAFGNWEDLNCKRDLIPIEKKFVNNRVKKGSKAFVVTTKDGPHTREIVDYNKELDISEDRKSRNIDDIVLAPFWISVFEGNNFIHLWNLDSKRNIGSTFIESRPLSDFYKNLIYSKVI